MPGLKTRAARRAFFLVAARAYRVEAVSLLDHANDPEDNADSLAAELTAGDSYFEDLATLDDEAVA